MSATTEYVTNALVWSAIGLLFGLVLGMGIRIKFLYWKLEIRYRDRVVGSLLIMVALGSIANGLSFQREQRKISDCQTRYNVAFQRTIQERASIADRDRRNVNTMVSTVLTARTAEESRKALELFVENNKKLDAERAGNKLPTKTGDTCGSQ